MVLRCQRWRQMRSTFTQMIAVDVVIIVFRHRDRDSGRRPWLLWLVDHQMNMKVMRSSAPIVRILRWNHSATIACSNALANGLKAAGFERRSSGNPPFVGAKHDDAQRRTRSSLASRTRATDCRCHNVKAACHYNPPIQQPTTNGITHG